MSKKTLRLLAAILACQLLAGCGGNDAGSKDNSGNGTEKQEKPVTTQTVLCLTEIISEYGEEKEVCHITYEEDGIHLTPETLTDTYVSVYDADGKTLYELRYNDEGNISYREDYTYNSKGQLTEWIDFDVEDNCKASRKTRSYNDQGQLLKEVYENRVSISYYDEYTYNTDGFLTEQCSYDGDGVLDERYEFVTDSEGKVQSCTGYRSINSGDDLDEWGVYTYSYDSEGRLISKVWELSVNYPLSNFSDYYTYDEKGNIIRYEMISHRKEESRTESAYTYTYNEDGFLISTVDEDGYSATYVYAEVEVPAAMAEMAQKWSCDGVKVAFVQHPED